MKTRMVLTTAVMVGLMAWSQPGITGMDTSGEMTDEAVIRQLRDLGLSPQDILDMLRDELRERQSGQDDGPTQSGYAQPGSTRSVSPRSGQEAPVVIQNSQPVIYVTAPQIRSVDDFREALSPYGTWMYVPPYGMVWQPAVTVVDRRWRPYYQGGWWEDTDDGWLWCSSYSWGWAPYHYGRWVYLDRHRWLWVPDVTWAPSWVQWRYSETYLGWAPLPPSALYQAGIGFSYQGSHVGFDFEFGMSDRDYCYVPAHHFHDADLTRIAVPREETPRVHRDTSVVRHTYTTSDRVIVPGPPREAVSGGGRRTAIIRRIVGQGLDDTQGGSLVHSSSGSRPAKSGNYITAEPDGRGNQLVQIASLSSKPAAYTPQKRQAATPSVAAAPNYWPGMGSRNRAEALLSALKSNGNTAPAAVSPRTRFRSRSDIPSAVVLNRVANATPSTAEAADAVDPADASPAAGIGRASRLLDVFRSRQGK